MSTPSAARRVTLPADSARIVAVLASVWVGLQVVGVIVGLGLVGRDGSGPSGSLDVSVHDWFVAHRAGLVGLAEVVAAIFDAPVLGAIVVAATLLAAGIAWNRHRLRWSLFAPLVAYVGAEATVYVVRLVIHRPRPPSANYPGPDAITGIHETSWSFPSGHGTAPIAVLVAVAGLMALRHRMRWPYVVAVALGLCIAASRLVLGVHWFTDVATGAILGTIWGATVCWAAARSDTFVMVDRPGMSGEP